MQRLLKDISGLVLLFSAIYCQAQELAPRAYWPAPTGTNVALVGYQHSQGDVLVDASAPIEGAEATLDFLSLTYQRTFGFWGRTASVQVNYPFVQGDAQAMVNGEFRERSITASADARARFAINLLGAPSMDGEAFRQLVANPEPIVGASVLVSAPTGNYDGDKLFNAGSNRWAAKPALGFILPLSHRWLFEGEIGAWLYEDNSDYQGKTRRQEAVLSSEFHLVHVLKSSTWISFDVNWYQGGAATVGDGPKQAELKNSRAGITLLRPFNRQHAIRLAASTAIESKIAGDFDSLTLAYMYVW
ncbi:transporter [Gilvimarinus xylanilyticus]|uniref:Transporter n=1 Tax=Gilvimarinus xylanilyticus TaxID=2944139 RepID=A0A9X2KST1_9GAMM|nr:transporter [Gilvimarinus xylanilyticus]MCP8898452.1 transporter [Gilvimarinus xylanilyticus]